MTAIREIVSVRNHQLSLKLPAGFDFEEVEVIVLPHPPAQKQKKSLMDVGVWSEEDAQAIQSLSGSFRHWNIEAF